MIKLRKYLKRTIVVMLLMLGVVSLFAVTYSIVLAVQSFMLDYDNYQAENGCIKVYTSQGIERSAIVRDNGTCFVME